MNPRPLLLLLLGVALLNPAWASTPSNRNTAERPAIATQGMISTGHPLATEAGLEILRAGGNAFDATVAVAAALNVVEPMMSGIGGYGAILTYDVARREARFLDCSGRIPVAVDADVFRAPTPNYEENRTGPKSVSTPGNVNAWQELSRRHGRLKWDRLFTTAIRLAEEGFAVSEWTADHIQRHFDSFPAEAKAFYGRGGQPLQVGERLVQKDLARSLRLIAQQGAPAVHGGELGQAIAQTMRELGGFLTLEDLRSNKAEWWEPDRIPYRGYEVLASAAPTNGWNGLLRLGVMSRWDVADLGHNSPEFLHRYAEVSKRAFADRLRYAGDPEVSPPPLARLFTESFWTAEAAAIDLKRAAPFVAPGVATPAGNYTTHYVVADQFGNVVSATQTLGNAFGSRIMVRGTGIWLNNSLAYSTFEPKGNAMDAFPGRRKVAGYSPFMILRDGRPWVAIGTPGGHTIVQTTPQMVMNLIDFGLDIQKAVSAPRLSFFEPATIGVDPGLPQSVRDALAARGHKVEERKTGNAHGLTVEYDAAGRPRKFTGGADTRGMGAAIGY